MPLRTKFRQNVCACFLIVICLHGEDALTERNEEIPEDLVNDLYSSYKDAFRNENEMVSVRRVLKNNEQYNIHVKKLQEVNGFKKHNLIIQKETLKDPIIYINNPVETKIPNAYMTLEEFKKTLIMRSDQLRDEDVNDINIKPIGRKRPRPRYDSIYSKTYPIKKKPTTRKKPTTKKATTKRVIKTTKKFTLNAGNVYRNVSNFWDKWSSKILLLSTTPGSKLIDEIQLNETDITNDTSSVSVLRQFSFTDLEPKHISNEEITLESPVTEKETKSKIVEELISRSSEAVEDEVITPAVKRTTASKRTTLSRPLVFMGGREK